MAKSLHDKFPEYKRIKFKAFKVTVEECFNKILDALNKQSESPEKETPKEKEAPKEAPKETPKEKEAPKEAPKETPKELPKGIFKIMPCPSTGPKIVCASPHVLCPTKIHLDTLTNDDLHLVNSVLVSAQKSLMWN